MSGHRVQVMNRMSKQDANNTGQQSNNSLCVKKGTVLFFNFNKGRQVDVGQAIADLPDGHC